MTDSDDTVARRYRELSREEPRAALDEAILAASRRAVAKPSLSRRWAAPVSIAAVLVLAFGVTLEMQREVPGIESAVPEKPAPAFAPAAKISQPPIDSQSAAKAEPQAAATIEPRPAARVEPKSVAKMASPFAARVEPRSPALQSAEDRFVPAAPSEGAAPRRKSDAAPAAASASEAPAPQAPPAASANEERTTRAPAAATASQERASSPAFAPSPAASSPIPSTMRATAKLKAEADAASPAQQASADPERELERIAKLREEGRHADADKALEQFRRDHPGYRIAEAMWERVRPR
jgi:hypothetical protein